jgi:hypothetical protein
MQKPGNYSVKFCEFYKRKPPALSDRDWRVLQYYCNLLNRAEHFMLPDYGKIMERSGRPVVNLGEVFCPPYPLTVLEYESPIGGGKPMADGELPCPQRIVLASDTVVSGEKITALVPVSFVHNLDGQRFWTLPMAVFTIHRNQSSGSFIKVGPFLHDLFKDQQNHCKSKGLDEQDFCHELFKHSGDEVSAFLEMAQALACGNVSTETIEPSKALNASRGRGKKPKLKSYKILTIGGNRHIGSSNCQGIGGARRAHLRRGHIRSLGEGKFTWVNSCFVRGEGGFVDKDYRVKGIV